MNWAYVFIDKLGFPRIEQDAIRRIIRLDQAWRAIPHTRRVVMLNQAPALRVDRIDQLKFNWSSVNPRTERQP